MRIEQTFVKVIDGKPFFSALYGMYLVTPNEMKMSAQAGQNGAVKKT
jgi:hypothetical protein